MSVTGISDRLFLDPPHKIALLPYWRAIERWLRSKIDEDIEELVFCGGTADYIRPEIDTYFQKEGIKVSWHADIFIPDEISSGMGNRMADVYALHQHMIIQFDKLTGYTRSEVIVSAKSSGASAGDSTTTDDPFSKFDFTPVSRPNVFITVNENA